MDYTMLHWLAVLVHHRQFQTTTPLMKRGKDFLKKYYYLPVENYDLIRGYRADDSYFSFAKAFLTNQISYMQLSHAMKLGWVGEQVVLKNKRLLDDDDIDGLFMRDILREEIQPNDSRLQ